MIEAQVTFENLSNAEQIGRVRFLSDVDGKALTAANVPEPRTAWLLLAGLAGLAGLRSSSRQPRIDQPAPALSAASAAGAA